MDMYAVFQVTQLFIRLLVYTFVGKGLLAIIVGQGYRENYIWRFFDRITYPLWRLTRRVAPRFIHDSAISYLAVFLLICLNIGLYMYFYSQGWILPLKEAAPAMK